MNASSWSRSSSVLASYAKSMSHLRVRTRVPTDQYPYPARPGGFVLASAGYVDRPVAVVGDDVELHAGAQVGRGVRVRLRAPHRVGRSGRGQGTALLVLGQTTLNRD